ncbi:MAG: hypothetical protein Q9164_002385 [Protoblastenia rupestris]
MAGIPLHEAAFLRSCYVTSLPSSKPASSSTTPDLPPNEERSKLVSLREHYEEKLKAIPQFRKTLKSDSESSTPRWTPQKRAEKEEECVMLESIGAGRHASRTYICNVACGKSDPEKLSAKQFKRWFIVYQNALKSDKASSRPFLTTKEWEAENRWSIQARRKRRWWVRFGPLVFLNIVLNMVVNTVL